MIKAMFDSVSKISLKIKNPIAPQAIISNPTINKIILIVLVSMLKNNNYCLICQSIKEAQKKPIN